MRSIVLAAGTALVLGGIAMAAAPSQPDPWMTPKAVPVSAETCTTAKAKFEAAEKTHAKSPNLAKAADEAKAAAADCKTGKSADGIAAYTAAIKLLST